MRNILNVRMAAAKAMTTPATTNGTTMDFPPPQSDLPELDEEEEDEDAALQSQQQMEARSDQQRQSISTHSSSSCSGKGGGGGGSCLEDGKGYGAGSAVSSNGSLINGHNGIISSSCSTNNVLKTWPQTPSHPPPHVAVDAEQHQGYPSQQPLITRVMLKLNPASDDPAKLDSDSFQAATIIEGRSSTGVFYERPVDDLVILDGARKLLYSLRPQEVEALSMVTSAKAKIPASAVLAARRWRRKQKIRRMRLQQQRSIQIAEEHEEVVESECPKHSESSSDENRLGEAGGHNSSNHAAAASNSGVGASSLPPLPPLAEKQHEADIEERILRRREMAHLFQWYYPEGGWGWVVVVCTCLAQAMAVGFQLGFGYPMAAFARKRFGNRVGDDKIGEKWGQGNYSPLR